MRSLNIRINTLLPLAILLLAPAMQGKAEETLHVYFIGNSLTMSTTLDRVHALFAERDIDLQYGSQLSGGKSLIRHLNYKDEPKQKWTSWETNKSSGDTYEPDPNHYTPDDDIRFGRYDTALVEHKWDKCVLQIYASNLHDNYKAITAFIDLALENGTCDTFYIYSTWPTRGKKREADDSVTIKNIQYAQVWEKDYPFTHEDNDKRSKRGVASRDYTAKLMELLNAHYPDLKQPIRLIPAGEVLYAVDKKIKAGELPELEALAKRQPDLVPGLDEDTSMADGINVLYADPIHLNPIPHRGNTAGIFLSGSTVFTVLSGENPVGLSAEPYGMGAAEDQALVRKLQEIIWDVVSNDPRTGVTP